MRRAPGGERGSFLLFAVVTLMILVMLFTWCLQLIFGDHLMVSKSMTREKNRQRALSLESQAMACLNGSTAASTCDATPVRACLNALQTDGAVITLSGAPPACVLKVTLP